MRSVANSRLPAVVLGTYHNVQRISRHGRLSILLRVHQRPAWVATCTRDGPQKPDGRPQLLQATRPHVADHDRPAKPRIMLIGWLGARKHHLDKYAQLWQSKGYDTSTVQPPTAGIVLPFIGDAAAKKYLDALEREHRDGTGLVFHIFSNAGFLFFGTLLRLLAARQNDGSRSGTSTAMTLPKLNSSVNGIIIDSAPAFITPDIAARGLASALLSTPADTVAAKHPVTVAAARAFTAPYLQLPAISGRQQELWQRWQDSSPLAPQLYLYSSADALIPPDRIRDFMASQAERGVEVHQHDFRDSPHVEHLRWHPAQYSAVLEDFMRGLLRSDTPQQSDSRQTVDASSALTNPVL